MYYSEVISFSIGGLIFLLQTFILDQATFCSPVSRYTRRISSVVLVILFLWLPSVHAEPLRVTVVLSEEGGVYQAFSDLLRVKLPVAKFALNTESIDQTSVTADVYVAVGMKAASALASRTAPVLSVLVPKSGYDRLLHGQHHSAIYLDQPMDRQVALLLDALPSIRHVGVLYSTPPHDLPHLRHLLAQRNVQLYEQAIEDEGSLNDALESILNESEVLFVLPDSGVYNPGTIRNILLATYRKQIPLIGISQTYVKAGALFAAYSTPGQIAVQTADVLRHFSLSGKLPASQYPKDFEVSVNKQVARSLDIQIKDEAKLRSEVREIP